MLLRGIIVDEVVMYNHRVYGVTRVCHVGDGVKIVYSAVHRLKVWGVGLLHLDGVEEGVGLHNEYVLWPVVAHGQREGVGVHLLVDYHGVGAVASHAGDGECVGQCRHCPAQHVFAVDGVVERAVDGRACRQRRHPY